MTPGLRARRALRLARIAGLALALPGCAILQAPPATQPGVANAAAWQARQQRLAAFDHWSLQGRAATGKLLGWTGNVSWRQQAEVFKVRVAGPLGAGGFRAEGTMESVLIRTEEKTFRTKEPEALVAKLLGWPFPLTRLRYWILGLPAPAAPATLTVDERGLLIGLKQSGWRLGYLGYTKVGGFQLPSRFALTNGETTIELVIDRWFDLPEN